VFAVAYGTGCVPPLLYVLLYEVDHHNPRWVADRLKAEVSTVGSWTVQLLTIVGVVVGAVGSFVSTQWLDRTRWQREEAHRWDTMRLECYAEFAGTIKQFMSIAWRICAVPELDLPSSGQPLDPAVGLPALAATEEDLSTKFERLLMLGSPEAVMAAREWREIAWELEKFARGIKHDRKEYERINVNYPKAREHFYAAARAELGIMRGEITEAIRPTSEGAPTHGAGT
jgi:hypothetical protein